MKRLFALRMLLIASLLVLSLAYAPAALADTPSHGTIPIDDLWTWSGEENPCGFDIVIHTFGEIRGKYWVDENGNVTRWIEIYGGLNETWSANGKTLNNLVHGPLFFKYISEDLLLGKYVGTFSLTVVPGSGLSGGGGGQIVEELGIDPDTGEIISEVRIMKVGSIGTQNDDNAICAYLGP